MKSAFTLLVFLFNLLLITNLNAQTCPTRALSLSKQADVDNFATTYPGCTQLPFGLIIRGTAITNLNGLSVLTSVAGLDIAGVSNLSSLSGLDNLTAINGSFNISSCTKLTNIDALSKVQTITGVTFTINNNPALTSLAGLSALTTLSPDLNLTISNNKGLSDLNGLNGLTQISGNITIYQNQGLLNLSGLSNLQTVSGFFLVEKNYKLQDLTGLSGLRSVGGHLTFANDTSLTSIAALSNLQTVGIGQGGNFYISGAKNLENLNGLENLSAINGLHLGDNAKLVNIRSLNHPITIGNLGLLIDHNVLLSDCAVRAVCDYIFSFPECPQVSIGIQYNNLCCRSCEEVRNVCSGNCCAPVVSITGEKCITTTTTTLTADAGKGNFTFLWNTNPPQTTPKVTVGPGTYCVTVTNTANDCTATACFTVCRPPTLNFSPSGTVTICKNDCINIKVSSGPGVSFLWSDGESKTARDFCPTQPTTTMSVTARNTNGCTSTGSVVLKTVVCDLLDGCGN